MYTWNVYYENADTDELACFIGIIQADTMSQALERASEYFEIVSHDLVVKRSDVDKATETPLS